MIEHPAMQGRTICDWCGAVGILVGECEVVLARLADGSVEPEAWCMDCQREVALHEALLDHGWGAEQ